MYPENLKYTRTHEWVRIEGRRATIGITWHAQKALGDIIQVVDYLEPGSQVEPLSDEETEEIIQMTKIGGQLPFITGKVLATIEPEKVSTPLYAPVNGKVVMINKELSPTDEGEIGHGRVVNDDPYGRGWMVVLEISDEKDLTKLLNAGEYQRLIETGKIEAVKSYADDLLAHH